MCCGALFFAFRRRSWRRRRRRGAWARGEAAPLCPPFLAFPLRLCNRKLLVLLVSLNPGRALATAVTAREPWLRFWGLRSKQKKLRGGSDIEATSLLRRTQIVNWGSSLLRSKAKSAPNSLLLHRREPVSTCLQQEASVCVHARAHHAARAALQQFDGAKGMAITTSSDRSFGGGSGNSNSMTALLPPLAHHHSSSSSSSERRLRLQVRVVCDVRDLIRSRFALKCIVAVSSPRKLARQSPAAAAHRRRRRTRASPQHPPHKNKKRPSSPLHGSSHAP